jgi:hypothetical protein
MACVLISIPNPFGLVRLLFEPTLLFWASEEQQAYWLPLSRAGKILVTYCQTELGHGNFVRGIETTATYGVNAEEFVVHSPTPSSTKFWPGGLGFSATHAVVMARLIIGSKDHPTRQIVCHRVCITEVRQRLCDFEGTARDRRLRYAAVHALTGFLVEIDGAEDDCACRLVVFYKTCA